MNTKATIAANRYEGRDLYPITDIRSVFKGVLTQHLDLDQAFVEKSVFPDSTSSGILDNLIGL